MPDEETNNAELADEPFEILKKFFPIEAKSAGDESPLVKISGILRNHGIYDSHTKEALAIIIGIMSSRLGDPIPIVITEDEGAGASQVLDTCLDLVPEDSWALAPTSNQKGSSTDQILEGRTLVSYDADKEKEMFRSILAENERKNALKVLQKRGIASNLGRISFVAISKNLNNPILQNPYVTRIHINADNASKIHRLDSMTQDSDVKNNFNTEIESACSRTLLKRISPHPVNIQFADKIVDQSAFNLQNIIPLYELTLRMIRNITRLNNPRQLDPREPFAAFIGIDFEEIIRFEKSGEDHKKVLESTKVDYHHFNLIFGDNIRSLNDYMSPRQERIYECIRTFNMTKAEHFVKKSNSELEILKHLLAPINVSSYWIDRFTLLDMVNADGGEQISSSTLFKELNELMKRDLIVRGKPKSRTLGYVHCVKKFPEKSSIAKTPVSEILDPVINGKEVEVRNFLTGANEIV
jgi:hypothetical protein